MRRFVGMAVVAVLAGSLARGEERVTVLEGERAATPTEEVEKIRDNLFLLEEAYNQEPGVIQHIQAFQVSPRTGLWTYSFTEEWPVPTDRHQLSVTLPLLAVGDGNTAGLGDLMLNYRLQAVGMGGKGPVAFAPRLSLAFPTGSYRTGAGRGMLGIQANLPLSVELGRWFVTHLNAGLTLTPAARSTGGSEATALDVNAGAALVWLTAAPVNFLVEAVYNSNVTVLDGGAVERDHAVTINPGVRFAVNFEGLQIVPGFSVPLRISPDGFGAAFLAYVSVEHVLWKPREVAP